MELPGTIRDRVIGESIASQLPGRQNGGAADAYRHVLLSAELTRNYGEGAAFNILERHEFETNGGADNGLDFWNNEIGITIGNHVRDNGGTWEDIVLLARQVMQGSFSTNDYNEVPSWQVLNADAGISLAYPRSSFSDPSLPPFADFDGYADIFARDFSFRTAGVSISLDNGSIVVPGIALTSPQFWAVNPVSEETGERLTIEESNFPTTGWVNGVGFIYETGNDAPPLIWEQENLDQCFLAGTPITMWPTDPSLKPGPDGIYDQTAVRAGLWTKPIEEIARKDLVVSYDDNGNMVPGFVPQTMTNTSKIILDFHGTWVTPGHVYWCVDGKYANQYAPLIDILRTDGAVEHQSGTKIRASTGCEVGSLEDELVTMAPLVNGQPDGNQARKIRLGTRMIRHDATEVTVMEGVLHTLGPIDKNRRFPNGQHVSEAKVAFFQDGPMPNPEDYVLIRSQTTLEEIYQANQWEAMRPQMPAPMVLESGPVQPLPADKVEQMKRNTPMAMLGLGQGGSPMAQKTLAGPGGKSPMNRKARKAAEAKKRKAAKDRKQVVH